MSKTRRSKTKYRNLDPNVNIKSRKDCLEGYNYINGVRNKNNELVIRPLNEEEKEWLDNFYAETIITDFYHSPELKELKKEISMLELKVGMEVKSDKVVSIERELELETDEVLKSKLKKKYTRVCKNVGKKQNTPKLIELRNKMTELQKSTLLYSDKEDQKEIYRENNIRNSCLYNYTKKQGNLIGIDLYETDRFSSEVEKAIDPENLLIFNETLGKLKDT